MTLYRPLLIGLLGVLALACGEDRTVGDEDPEGTSAGETTGETDGWDSPHIDLGSDWEPRFDCDDPDALIPEGVDCQDAIPGDEAPAEDQAAVKEAFGEECGLERMCGEQWGVDCQATVDGPYYYVDPETLEVVATCGGACWVEACENCPPEGWNCPLL